MNKLLQLASFMFLPAAALAQSSITVASSACIKSGDHLVVDGTITAQYVGASNSTFAFRTGSNELQTKAIFGPWQIANGSIVGSHSLPHPATNSIHGAYSFIITDSASPFPTPINNVDITQQGSLVFDVCRLDPGSYPAPTGVSYVYPQFDQPTVTTLAAGSSATVTITGTALHPHLIIGIPQGAAGTGGGGGGGATPVISVDAAALAAGSSPTATISGPSATPTIHFGIPAGAKGDTGLQGIQGVAGTPGAKGDTGLQGIQGVASTPGAKGDTGLQGIQGVAGTPGAKGDTGLQGIQGVAGTPGAKGDTGLQGIQGVAGTPGTAGAKGVAGTPGTAGAKGDTGLQGIQGIQGIQGVAGANGTSAPVTTATCSGTYTLAFPTAGDIVYDLTLSAACTLSMTAPSTSTTYRRLTLFIRPAGFQATLPASSSALVWRGGSAPVPSTSSLTVITFGSTGTAPVAGDI